jgi:hypothetical protein
MSWSSKPEKPNAIFDEPTQKLLAQPCHQLSTVGRECGLYARFNSVNPPLAPQGGIRPVGAQMMSYVSFIDLRHDLGGLGYGSLIALIKTAFDFRHSRFVGMMHKCAV